MANTGSTNHPGIDSEVNKGGLENLDRRGFLRASAIATTALAVSMILPPEKAEAQEVQLAAYSTESGLGINYSEIADSPLDSMLREGEDEFVANASKNPLYQKLGVGRAWTSYSRNIAREKITKQTLGELMENTPNLLVSFADLPPSKYPLLQAIGRLQKVNGRSQRLDDMLERAKEIAGALNG